MFITDLAHSVCSSTIARTNYGAREVLGSARLNLDFSTVYSRVNELPGDCITAESITTTQIDDGTIANADISASAAIAPSKLAVSNYAISSSSGGAYTNATTSFTDVTNLSVTITTNGKPVEIYLANDGSANTSKLVSLSASKPLTRGFFRLLRGATTIGDAAIATYASTSPVAAESSQVEVPLGSVRFFDTPAAGTYTYKIQAAGYQAGDTVSAMYAKLVAREL